MVRHDEHLRRPDDAPRVALTLKFSIACLVGLVLVMAGLIGASRELIERQLAEHETRANNELARMFSNTVWRRYRDFVLASEGATRDELLAAPSTGRILEDVRRQMRGLSVVKIKIYSPSGLTVFSTDASQIGEDQGDNEAFLSALEGESFGYVTYRETFDAMEGVLLDRDLVASYVPLRNPDSEAIEGVIEVYSDVSAMLASRHAAQWQVAGLVLALLAFLYAFLLTVVRRADVSLARLESQRLEREERIRHQALHDHLTGLPNRSGFPQYLDAAIRDVSEGGRGGALMYVDLDRFKDVNDRLGHAAGDDLLVELATRMQRCMRGTDRLFRMGGDEFTAVIGDADGLVIDGLSERLLEEIRRPIVLCGETVIPGATIGVAPIPTHTVTADALLKKADAAMYRAKSAGRGTCAYHGREPERMRAA